MSEDEEVPFNDETVGRYAGFKFISFNKAVASIGGDNAKFSRKFKTEKDEDGTFFTEALTKWNDADHSADYAEFSDSLPSNELQTYAQLLFHSKSLIESLLQQMRKENSKSIPAFCELLTALAQDLRKDFSQYMWESFDVLTNILDLGERNKDSVEAAFFCLTTLVKLVWKTLIKNVKKSFTRFVPLFGSSREYVRRFAAEAFAFLLRKMDDIKEITKFIVEQVCKVDDEHFVNGAATLFFHVYRGLAGGFHSAADEQFRDIVLGIATIEAEDIREKGVEILEVMLTNTVTYVQKAKSGDMEVIEKTLLSILDASKSKTETTIYLRLLPLLFVEKKSKLLFTKDKQLFVILKKIIPTQFALDDYTINFLEKAITLLYDKISWNSQIKDFLASIIARDSQDGFQNVLSFLFKVYKINMFDLGVLPSIASLADRIIKSNDQEALARVFLLYAAVCADRKPMIHCQDRISFFDVKAQVVVKKHVLSVLANLSKVDTVLATCYVTLWPWLFSEHEKVDGIPHVVNFLKYLLNGNENSLIISQASYITAWSIHTVQKSHILEISQDTLENFLKVHECAESALRVYQLYLSASGQQTSIDSLLRVADLLKPAFFSSNTQRRKTALEVLSSFKVEWEGSNCYNNDGSKMEDPVGVFSILYQAECCNLTDSRARLLQFRKLLYGAHNKQMPKNHKDDLEEIILRVGYAQFFIQFSLLWPGMHELLTSFARGMPIDKFWGITSEIFETIQEGSKKIESEEVEDVTFQLLLKDMDTVNRHDYLSARVQLLKFFMKISDIAERRTRILSPLLLDLYRNDFLRMTSDSIVEEDDNEDGKKKLDHTAERRKLTYAELCKAMCAFLDLFSKFSDAKSVYLEKDIRKMYDELLISGHQEIMKSTVACLFSYKDNRLSPYRENFDGILDEKTFRDQLVLFKISEDEDDAVVASDHRPAVFPILLRVLFGKLNQRGKKSCKASRRIAIFRYLSGCRPHELQAFLEIAFQPIFDVVGNSEDMYDNMVKVCANFSQLDNIKLKSLQVALNNGGELARRIPTTIVDEQQTFLYRLLICVGVVIRSLLLNKEIAPYKQEIAKDMRILLSDTLKDYFSVFYNRKFTNQEISQLMEILINCYFEKAVAKTGETIAIAPQSAVKLLTTFCKFPTLYHMLTIAVKPSFLEEELTVLDVMIAPLIWNGLSSQLLQMIRGALLHLLTYADEDGMIKKETSRVKILNEVSYGTSVAVGHISRLLVFLADSLESDSKSSSINLDNLEIINRLSDFVSEGELGERMASTILSYLRRNIPKDEVAVKMLTTLARLVEHSQEPENYLKLMPILFSTVNGKETRNSLMSVCSSLIKSKKLGSEINELLDLVIDLDSWDSRKIDEPDFDRRHDAYSRLFKIFESDKPINEHMFTIFAHTSIYSMTTSTDISLRSSSSSCARVLIEHLSKTKYAETFRSELLDKNIIPLTLKGFKSDQENVREECVHILATLVSSFPNHSQLKYLVVLQQKDENIDFFFNIHHIQMHRRQRAIHRLVDQISKEKAFEIPFEPMNRFLMPIVTPYLTNVTSKTSALSDESLRLLNLTMSLAPWSKYSNSIDYWMNRLDKENDGEKPFVRILCSIIDAFHFEVAEAGDELAEDGSNKHAITIRNKIVDDIMPRLQRCINGKSEEYDVHRRARTATTKYYSEDDDILRAPVALATIKLLQKLPTSIMDQYLHGVILKLCSLMMSRSMNVRETARKITVQVCDCLGPKYLPSVIREIKLIMNKGFQLHVMVFTIHSLIYAMQSRLVTGDLDSCLNEIMDVCIQDQFEGVSEEKEIGAIRYEVSEAKSNKTPDTLHLLGRYVSSTSIGFVLDKMHKVVDTKTSSKSVTRVGELLTKFAQGITSNHGITVDQQLILVHQVLTGNVEKMENVSKPANPEEEKGRRPQSCYILPEAPKRVGALIKASVKSRVHVFVEFALQLLSFLVNGKVFDSNEATDIAKIDPFVPMILRCLSLKYDKVISFGLKCMSGFLNMNLPSVQNCLKEIAERFFVLLSDYSSIGYAANKQSILQLNHLLFKAFTKIITMSSSNFLTKKHVELLLNYVETDVLDSQKQATAFSLIKAIVRKKIEHQRLPEVLRRLEEMSITSTQPHIRSQCRETVCDFVGNHPNAGSPSQHLEFFANQLEYQFADGRISAAESLHQLFSNLLPVALEESCVFCITKLGVALVNDDVPKCRKYVAGAIRQLIESVNDAMRSDIGDLCVEWLGQPKEAARAVGVGIFVQLSYVEQAKFADRLSVIAKLVIDVLSSEDMFDRNSEMTLVNLLEGLNIMIQNCGADKSKEFVASEEFYDIIGLLQPLCKCAESNPIRNASAAVLGMALSLWDTPIKMPKKENVPSISDIIDWMCWQLRDNMLNHDVADQASKNIVCISVSLNNEEFKSLIEKLFSICLFEIRHKAKQDIKRLTCFKIAAALAVREKSGPRFDTVVNQFFPLFVREMNRKSALNTDDLFNLATEIGGLLQNLYGDVEYNKRLAEAQKQSLLKAEERKRKIKELAVTAPEEAAELKRKKNLKKVVNRKRKLDALKPYRIAKRKHAEKQKLQRDEDD